MHPAEGWTYDAFAPGDVVHLLDGDLGKPLSIPQPSREESANRVQTDATPPHDIREAEIPEFAEGQSPHDTPRHPRRGIMIRVSAVRAWSGEARSSGSS